ncbi:unnamed protein product [Mytilus coruscus]|uniref:Uncharacterized protein n=1 Tax=Mytilus coruscus TaxID=42192 RepID=A0A6J8A6H8_MYTCO|nr:unnamed protein product [Mytilus coruscus]
MKQLGGMIRVCIPENVRYNKYDIYQLFSSVAQINKVIIHRKERCADVYLFKRSSIEFVLNQAWVLRGQHLTVYNGFKFLRRYNDKNFQSQISSQQRHNLKYSYSDYKLQRSAFWTDVPHHKSKPTRQKLKTMKVHSSSLITKQNNRKKGSQSLKPLKSRNSGKSKQSIQINKTTARNCDSDRFLKHSILNEDPSNTNISVSTENGSVPEEPSKTCETPVYLMYQESHTLLQLTSLSYDSIINEIRSHTLIPYSLLLLYHHGKCLHGNMFPDIQPYDSILVLVKGVGGMRKEDNPEYVTEKSSEDEVTNWLVQSLGLTTDLVESYNLKELNGKLLYKYSLESLEEFASVLPNIPIGLLRKILILRKPSEKTKKILTLPEGKWKCEDVETFVRQTLKGTKETVDKICKFIHEKAIDSVVFFSYCNFKDIQKDFSSSKEYGLQFDKIITTKEEILDCIQESQTVPTNKLKKEGLNKPYSDVAKFVPFLQDRLKLDKVSENQNITPKSLNLSIIYNAWKSKNELESKVLFLILCKNSDQIDSETQRIVWSKIRQNLRVWRQHFDDAPSRALFVESDDNEYLSYNGEHCNTFDKHLATYEINLQIPGEEPVLYRFSFRKGMKYWQFDHQNAANGFWSSTLITEDSEIPDNPLKYISQEQSHRPFLASGEDIQYIAGKVFPTCESGGTLADRCFEYKYFASSLITIDKAISKFLIETLRFACGVLNYRKNGTIAFGIGDDVNQIEGRSLKHGEIVGFYIHQMSKDFKSKFTDALDNAENKCFHDASKDKAVM